MKGLPERLTRPTNLAAIRAELEKREGNKTPLVHLEAYFARRIRDEGSEGFVADVISAGLGDKLKWREALGDREERGQCDDE